METSLQNPESVSAAWLRKLITVSKALWGRPVAIDEAEAQRMLSILEEREKSVCDCLVTVIAGGTKVGKTTMINALAGKPIGEASAKACFTRRPTIYVHQRREGMARRLLNGVLSADDRIVSHTEDALEHLILIDTPDLDGIDETNRKTFAQLLERADLVLCVVTAQKYDSLDLYSVLVDSMSFRRIVVVLNRLDEGMRTPREQDAIVADLRAKIGALPLKTPLGEELPVFRLSAHNAFLAKTGQGGGPRWEFPKFEEYLHKRLDEAVARRIQSENQTARAAETAAWIESACGLAAARQTADTLRTWCEEFMKQSRADIREAARTAVAEVAPELVRRRESAAAARLGGPFGAYVRTSLTVSLLAARLQSLVTSPFGDPVIPLAERLAEVAGTATDELLTRGRRQVTETADRAGLDPAPLIARIDAAQACAVTTHKLTVQIREFLDEPRPGGITSLALNALPLLIILLLVRYFVTALLTAHEPAAGMFIGGGFLFWLVCHLQAGFWLARQAGTLDGLSNAVEELFSSELHRRLAEPALAWTDEVRSLGG